MKTIDDLKADKRARDKARKDKAEAMFPNRGMATSGYHDIDGNFIPLDDAPQGLAAGVTNVDGSGDVTLYNNRTGKHHTIVKGTGNDSDSKAFVANHNKGLRDSLIVNDAPAPSIAELKQRDVNIERRHQESQNRTTGGPLLDGDNY